MGATDKYILMHRDDPCAFIAIDPDSGALIRYKTMREELVPFLGGATEKLMKKWWDARAIPGSRADMQRIIREAGAENGREYLAKNLALSISDTYWICPENTELHYADVNLHRFAGNRKKIVPYHNASSYDPNASLGGQMNKYWDLSTQPPTLFKVAYQNYGQQCVNEAFATMLHQRQSTEIPFTEYTLQQSRDNGIICSCAAFTSCETELVPAFEVMNAGKKDDARSPYDTFIAASAAGGADEKQMRCFMDYLTLTDFVISNADEHLMNFGVLRDTGTMKIVGPAPIFDSGNSMFFDEVRLKPFTREELLSRRITALYPTEEKLLSRVHDKNSVKEDRLPTPAETLAFYAGHRIPEERAAFIASSYEEKLRMLREFQSGITISLYRQKHGEVMSW